MSALVLAVVSMLAAQDAAAEPAAAAPAGRRFVLAEPTKARFTVMTNVGELTGTIDVVRVDARGLDWGAFELWVELDPASVVCRDPVLDAHIGRTILRSDEGPIVFGSSERLPPRARPGEGATPDDEMPGARFYLDARRGGRMVEARMLPVVEGDKARVRLKAQGTLAALGLPPSSHPFVEVTGPLVVELDAPLQRRK